MELFLRKRQRGNAGIRLILDTFPNSRILREDEKAVLKAVLIIQATNAWRYDFFKATEQNLSYVFEGILIWKERLLILLNNLYQREFCFKPISGGRHVAAAVLAGDQAKIDSYKNIHNSTTSNLLPMVVFQPYSLSPALRLRFELSRIQENYPVTAADFTHNQ